MVGENSRLRIDPMMSAMLKITPTVGLLDL
jgi:hypothetical protein